MLTSVPSCFQSANLFHVLELEPDGLQISFKGRKPPQCSFDRLCGDQHLSAALGLLTRCLFIIAAPTACDRLSPAKLILMRAGDTITESFCYLGLGVRCDAGPSSIIKPRGQGLEPLRWWQAWANRSPPLNYARLQVSREMRLLQSC